MQLKLVFEPGSLQARSCSETTGCTSEAGASAGKYCGFCTQVRGTYNVDDIYQYAPFTLFYFTSLNSGRGMSRVEGMLY
jgi:hypothetical protein